jgi:hypothetical protein
VCQQRSHGGERIYLRDEASCGISIDEYIENSRSHAPVSSCFQKEFQTLENISTFHQLIIVTQNLLWG